MFLYKRNIIQDIPELALSNKKMNKYITIMFILLIMLSWGIVAYLNDINKVAKEESFTYIEEIVSQSANNINVKINGDLMMLESMAITFGKLEDGAYEETLKDFNENPQFDAFQRFGIINTDGEGFNQTDLSYRGYFKLAMKGTSNISDTVFSRIENLNVNVYATPIWKNNEIVGVLTGTIIIDTYKDILFSKVLDKKTESFIFKNDGSIIMCSKHSGRGYHKNNIFDETKVMKDEEHYRKIAALVRVQNGLELPYIAPNGSKNYLNIHNLGINDWYLGVVIPQEVIDQKLEKTIRTNVYSGAISIFILTALLLYIIYIHKKSKAALVGLAYYDELTKCPNKNFFINKGSILVKEATSKYAYVVLNIRQFKIINDKYGYKNGDKLLKYISNVLALEIRPDEIFSRFSADNFHILLKYEQDDMLKARIEKINEKLLSFRFNNDTFHNIVINYGIKIIDSKDDALEIIGDRAILALYKAKESSTRNFVYYNEEMRKEIMEEQELENQTMHAFENYEFELYIQPKYLLDKSEITGGEALVRWNHPEKGIIFPDKFISLFEKNGSIARLDIYMMEQTCQWLSHRISNNMEYIPLSVNQSRVSFYSSKHVEELKAIVEKYGVATNLIEIEITENVFLENFEYIKQVVEKLHEYGFKISMDDFGSGHSSLNMLQDIYVDVIKLDRKFFNQNANIERGQKIIKNIVSMANDLDMEVIAEGVEFEEQVEFLRSIKCNKAQGYYFSKPVSVKDFDKLIN